MTKRAVDDTRMGWVIHYDGEEVKFFPFDEHENPITPAMWALLDATLKDEVIEQVSVTLVSTEIEPQLVMEVLLYRPSAVNMAVIRRLSGRV